MGVATVKRYSEAFKMQVVRELESGELASQCEARRRYGIPGGGTINMWLRKYGMAHLIPKVVTVAKADERDELERLRKENRRLKEALADEHVRAVLGEAYLSIACEMAGVKDVAEFKKKHDANRSGGGGR